MRHTSATRLLLSLLALLLPAIGAADDFVNDSTDTGKFMQYGTIDRMKKAIVDERTAILLLKTGNTGTNTGDVTIAAVGAATANGASLSGQALSLTPADTTHPGIVTTGTQTMAGAKTLTGATTMSGGATATTPQPASLATSGTAATDVVTATGGKGGNTTGVTGQTAGSGANVLLTAGAGGNAPSGSTNGTGGSITITPGTAGAGAGTAGTAGKIVLAGDVSASTATFTGAIGASNLSGTNSGDVTLSAVGSSPSANGATLSTQALTLQPADGSHPGVVTATAQTFGGVKTFAGIIVGSTSLSTCGTNVAEFTISQQGGGTGGTRSKLCMCTSDGAGTPSYAWKNITAIFADDASSIGTSTTCP